MGADIYLKVKIGNHSYWAVRPEDTDLQVLRLTKRSRRHLRDPEKGTLSKCPRKMQRIVITKTFKSLEKDYDANYLVTGRGLMRAYDPDCHFVTSFASFDGVDRFKQHVSRLYRFVPGSVHALGLSSMLLQSQGKVPHLEFTWKFSARLQVPWLPWRPQLEANVRTEYVNLLETGKIVQHTEEWEWESGQTLLRQLFKLVETQNGKRFVLALSEGDVQKMWLSSSGWLWKAGSALVLISCLINLVTMFRYEAVVQPFLLLGVIMEAVSLSAKYYIGDDLQN